MELAFLCVFVNFRIFSTDGFCNLKVNLLAEAYFVVLAPSFVVFVKLRMKSLVYRFVRLLELGVLILLVLLIY